MITTNQLLTKQPNEGKAREKSRSHRRWNNSLSRRRRRISRRKAGSRRSFTFMVTKSRNSTSLYHSRPQLTSSHIQITIEKKASLTRINFSSTLSRNSISKSKRT
jgi:hypothetical protein